MGMVADRIDYGYTLNWTAVLTQPEQVSFGADGPCGS